MKDIVLELTAAEALIVLGAIQDKQLDASTLAAISTGEEHEIADLSAGMLGRIAVQIVDALYPEPGPDAGFEDDDLPPDLNREGDPAFNGAFTSW